MHARTALWVTFAALVASCTYPAPGRTLAPATAAGTEPAASPTLASPPSTPPTTPSPVPAAAPTTGPDARCLDRAALVDDVTIRDYTPLTPGESFTKIWRLQNKGTCTWTPEYALVFFGGERMQAPASIPLGGPVPPGAIVDLSVDMTAPAAPGIHEGYWRLRNASGTHFALGAAGDQSFWVRIVVRPVLTPTLSPTLPPTASPTPAVLVSAALDLAPSSALDLDTGTLEPGTAADIVFGPGDSSSAALLPQGATLISLYSPPPDPPRPIDCLGAPLRPEPIPATLLGSGSIACYLTGQSHPGYLVVVSVGDTLSLAFTTWVP